MEEHQLSDREFKCICDLVYNDAGIVLTESKREMVYRRLMRRTRELKISSFSEYCGLINTPDSEELPHFINAITTNLTSFFREPHHFDYLRDQFIPQHLKAFRSDSKLRIWSSACSTGEEPYTLAITVKQAMASYLRKWDVRILATDLDTNVLKTAAQGIYEYDGIKDLSDEVKRDGFNKGIGNCEGLVKVKTSLADLISFKQLNLLRAWPMKGPFDAILCRNVLIYFDKDTQLGLLKRFVEILRPGGVIILGHSESVAKSFPGLNSIGRTIYQKVCTYH
ncbi:chemotaxis protein CheR [Candidatus Endobugula sertula]|uniref:Chemotaxis protein methyltransferase n=1 Tax=Candidatus Endobugula sertula TaxID=62101 RepID=A0A1D2QQX9_9GAMM|nr:chemotaxis protein CheR [Candidatus Endobugula sertula]